MSRLAAPAPRLIQPLFAFPSLEDLPPGPSLDCSFVLDVWSFWWSSVEGATGLFYPLGFALGILCQKPLALLLM